MGGSRWVKSSNVVARRVGDELLLVPIIDEAAHLARMFVLQGVGARVWELLDEAGDAEGVAAAVAAEYEVTPDVARADVGAFVAELARVGALLPAGSP